MAEALGPLCKIETKAPTEGLGVVVRIGPEDVEILKLIDGVVMYTCFVSTLKVYNTYFLFSKPAPPCGLLPVLFGFCFY